MSLDLSRLRLRFAGDSRSASDGIVSFLEWTPVAPSGRVPRDSRLCKIAVAIIGADGKAIFAFLEAPIEAPEDPSQFRKRLTQFSILPVAVIDADFDARDALGACISEIPPIRERHNLRHRLQGWRL